MSQRRQIAARANAPLLRNLGVQRRVQHADEQIRQLRTRPRVSFREHIRTEQHECPHFALREQRTNASRVAAHKVDLKLPEPVTRDRDLRQLAKARCDAVRHLVSIDERLHDAPRRTHAAGGRWR
jgi:hypothetical protein